VASVNKGLIKELGKTIIAQVKEDLQRSDTILVTDRARTDAQWRIKTIVEGRSSLMSAVERDALLNYVSHGVLGDADPDSWLDQFNEKTTSERTTTEKTTSFDTASPKPYPSAGTLVITEDGRAYRDERFSAAPPFAGIALALILAGAMAVGFLKGMQESTQQANVHLDPKLTHYFMAKPDIWVKRNPKINYDIDLSKQPYFVYVPENYTGKKPFGLVVYVSNLESCQQVPQGWKDVLAERQLLLVIPQNAGNTVAEDDRVGRGVMGALAMMKEYNIDRSRIYAAGFSGGARSAGDMGFWQSDLVCGTIQDCGSNFVRPVKHERGKNWIDSNGNRYGVADVDPGDVQAAHDKVRFVLITGPRDFRHGNLLDLYENGFHKSGFHCKLIDVPNMGHEDCSGDVFDQALSYIAAPDN
jgi:hypothetical protein